MGQVITDATQATPEWLTGVLRASSVLGDGSVVAVKIQPPIPGNSAIVPLELTYSAGVDAPTRIILKLAASRNRANRREVEFYAAIRHAQHPLPVIRCYDAVYDDDASTFHLLLEDLSATHESHPPSFLPPTIANAERIVDALVALHVFWWDHPQLGVSIGSKPTDESIREMVYDEAMTIARFADYLGDRLSDARRSILEKVLNSLVDIRVQRMVNAPHLTLAHGDLHAGNFLYPRDPARNTIRLIDWKSWNIAPGVSDLANMMGVFWIRERRLALQQILLERYYQRLSEYPIVGYDWDACWEDYRWSIVNYLPFPIWQWSVGTPDFIWWHNLDRLMIAFEDLHCAELIAG
ncbi:MAG: phosphotransferase [Aggregatilineales bacterium]